VLVGDGPERAALAQRCPEFHYAGMQRGEALAAHYASADVFLFASVTETFGNVVTEALASGLVVVGYNYVAVREHMQDDVNGLVVPLHDAEAFCRRAVEALERRAEWPRWRAGARATALGVTWAAIFETFEAALQRAANARLEPVIRQDLRRRRGPGGGRK
jgi:glycosyltransferase involved in cell wall biosynthesis